MSNHKEIILSDQRKARVFAPSVGSVNDAYAMPARHDIERRTIMVLHHTRFINDAGEVRNVSEEEIKGFDGISVTDFDLLAQAYDDLSAPRADEDKLEFHALEILKLVSASQNPVLNKDKIIKAIGPLLPNGDSRPFTSGMPSAAHD